MQSLVITLGGFGIVGLSMLIRAAFQAPEGIEDERGFHFLDSSDRQRYLDSRATLSAGEVLFFK